MQKYSYKGLTKLGIIYTQIWGIIGLIIFTGVAIFSFWGVTKIDTATLSRGLLNDPRVTLICFGVIFLFVGWWFSFAILNSAPTIWVTEEGILISAYLFFKIKIVWSDILYIKEHKIGPYRTGHSLVFARRISFFHRAIGLIFDHSFYPGFAIRKEIDDYDLLLRMMRLKTLLGKTQ